MLILALFFMEFSFAQNSTVIDTSNVDYREKLAQYYDSQTSKTETRINEIEDKKIRKQFLINYTDKTVAFKELINKGVFVEHNSFTNLCNEILTKINASNPTQKLEDIKILLAVSDEVNAYNCGEGLIVVDLPLIYKMDNEYELAYVIAHEISHQKLDHVYQSMMKHNWQNNSEELKKKTDEIDQQKYNKSSLASGLFKKIVYTNREESRKLEHQADSLGYILFRNAYPDYESYSVETLRKLKWIDEEKEALTKEDFLHFFEVSNTKFKDEWLVSEIAIYNYQKNAKFWNIDSLRTHPDCDTRISFLKENFKIQEKNKSVDVANFNLQKINSDKEFVFGLYFLEEYGKSLYYTLLKSKKNPKEEFFKKMIYDNLIKLRDARNNYTLNKYLENEKPKFPEDYNQFLCLIRNLRKNELTQIIEFYK